MTESDSGVDAAASYVARVMALPRAEQKKAAKELADSGLFAFDRWTRRLVWLGLFLVLLAVVVGSLLLINHSFSVDITTTTGEGANKVVAVTHPDVAAGWAAIAAVISGLIGVFVPSPTSRTSSESPS